MPINSTGLWTLWDKSFRLHFPSYIQKPTQFYALYSLKLGELLAAGDGLAVDTDNVEANSLGERAALADSDGVTLLDTESGRKVSRELHVALLVTVVLLDEVEVVTKRSRGKHRSTKKRYYRITTRFHANTLLRHG